VWAYEQVNAGAHVHVHVCVCARLLVCARACAHQLVYLSLYVKSVHERVFSVLVSTLIRLNRLRSPKKGRAWQAPI